MVNLQRRHVHSNLRSCQWPVHQIRDSFVELHIVFVGDADSDLEDANVSGGTGSIICLRKKHVIYIDFQTLRITHLEVKPHKVRRWIPYGHSELFE